jgi:hypothetical protein
MGRRLTFSLRRGWNNHTGNVGVDPLREYTPRSLAELQEVVRTGEHEGTTVRAIGSGHSWSDVAVAPGFLLHPLGLTRELDLEAALLRERPPDAAPLVRVESGIRIRELNALLDAKRPSLALPNMGGYDGQTIAGVVSTATHGSGRRFGPLADMVRSLDLVASGGEVWRIEPENGPTDPDAYRARHPERRLKQDDVWFHAAVVGMGCMGVIHSLILEVGPAHYLREIRTRCSWSEVKDQLAGGALDQNDHYELLFSPYPRRGEIDCLVTRRNRITPDEYREDRRRQRNWFVEAASRFPLTPWVGNVVIGIWPGLTPALVRMTMRSIENPDYVNKSFKVLNIGAANYLPAYSGEIGVPVDERGLHLAAVDTIVEVAARHRQLGQAYQSAPISLRFVKASKALLSMMEGRETMMIELIMQTHTQGGMELLAAYEDRLYELEGRPHWGQVNAVTPERLAELYPQLPDWLRVHEELNASGVFNSPFSKRVGISPVGSS